MAKSPKQNQDLDDEEEERTAFTLRVPKTLLVALNKYRNEQRFPPDRQTVIQRLLEDFLESEGFWPPGESGD